MDKISAFGIMKEYNIDDIKELINILAADGYPHIVSVDIFIVKLRKKAVKALKNKEKILLRETKESTI